MQSYKMTLVKAIMDVTVADAKLKNQVKTQILAKANDQAKATATPFDKTRAHFYEMVIKKPMSQPRIQSGGRSV